jgi:anti-sigma-K factor RskA
MSSSIPPRDRLWELLADRALDQLSAAEQQELDKLLAEHRDISADELDLAAAATYLALTETSFEPLPLHLQERIAEHSRQYYASISKIPLAAIPNSKVETVMVPAAPSRWQWAGWFAAAACLLLAAWGWWPRLTPQRMGSAVVARAELLSKPDVVKADLPVLPDAASSPEAKADLVWSQADQTGYLRLRGIAPNDPRKHQYQIWIFDGQQDDRYPISGGVFDVSAADIDPTTGEAVVPINPEIKVATPKMIAVTVEKPGGVVVSGRERVVILGKLGG